MKSQICIGDFVIMKEEYFVNLNLYFNGKPRKVVGIDRGPMYAGGFFINVDLGNQGGIQGFYLNSLRRATDEEVQLISEWDESR